MPYTKKDYPDSMKNMNKIARIKAIDILNAMLKDGYDESRAIPIAISKAKDWYEDASNKEKSEMKKEDVTDHKKDVNSSAKLQDADVIVEYSEEDGKWRVISKGAEKADSLHKKKSDALDRAKEMLKFREAKLISKKRSE
ncbi:DUF2188 domain-containing protein [Peptoniphilus sp.]|jgi:uncharacterized protein YdaT|uniref:DUF2188 domain-containing protein n=1 Tax=Peptoniphilus sp. TaxID=1971214 RepID=UPI003D8A3B0D